MPLSKAFWGTEIALVGSEAAARQQAAAAHRRFRPLRGQVSVAVGRITGSTQIICPNCASVSTTSARTSCVPSSTMLGMIFGVAAVVAMLSIGAGAQQEVMAFIEQLGVRNLIVEARESSDYQSLQKIRKISPGLTFQDFPVIKANLEGHHRLDRAQAPTPTKMLPRPQSDVPVIYGVSPEPDDRQPARRLRPVLRRA